MLLNKLLCSSFKTNKATSSKTFQDFHTYKFYCYVSGLTEDLSEAGNPVLDHEMTENMLSHNNNQGFKEMLDFRKKLPSFTMREVIELIIHYVVKC